MADGGLCQPESPGGFGVTAGFGQSHKIEQLAAINQLVGRDRHTGCEQVSGQSDGRVRWLSQIHHCEQDRELLAGAELALGQPAIGGHGMRLVVGGQC